MGKIKRKKLRIWSLVLLVLILPMACNKGEKTKKSGETSSQRVKKPDRFKNKFKTYGEMLTLQDIQALIQLDSEMVIVNDSEGLGTFENCFYIWPSDRPEIVSEQSVLFKFPDNNQIGVKGLSSYDSSYSEKEILDVFEFGYKQLDDKDIEAISKNLEKEYSKKSKSERKTAESLIETRKNMTFQKVHGVGNSAYWRFSEKNGGDLVVLSGNEYFTLNVKISLDLEENLEIAKKLAGTILEKDP